MSGKNKTLEATAPVASSESKAKCGCWVEWFPGHGVAGAGWKVTASSFLCPVRHEQGVYIEDRFAPGSLGCSFVTGQEECMDCGYDEANCCCDAEFDDDWDCTHCGGDGICDEGYDDIGGSCPSAAHYCHACKGTGRRRDQVIF